MIYRHIRVHRLTAYVGYTAYDGCNSGHFRNNATAPIAGTMAFDNSSEMIGHVMAVAAHPSLAFGKRQMSEARPRSTPATSSQLANVCRCSVTSRESSWPVQKPALLF